MENGWFPTMQGFNETSVKTPTKPIFYVSLTVTGSRATLPSFKLSRIDRPWVGARRS